MERLEDHDRQNPSSSSTRAGDTTTDNLIVATTKSSGSRGGALYAYQAMRLNPVAARPLTKSRQPLPMPLKARRLSPR